MGCCCCASTDTELEHALSASVLFGVAPRLVRRASSLFARRQFAANEVIWAVGDPLLFSIIHSGEVRIVFDVLSTIPLPGAAKDGIVKRLASSSSLIIEKRQGDCFGFALDSAMDASSAEKATADSKYHVTAIVDTVLWQLLPGSRLPPETVDVLSLIRSTSVFRPALLLDGAFLRSLQTPLSSEATGTSLLLTNASIISSLFRLHLLRKGQVLFEEGCTDSESFYIVAKGCVVVLSSKEKSPDESNSQLQQDEGAKVGLECYDTVRGQTAAGLMIGGEGLRVRSDTTERMQSIHGYKPQMHVRQETESMTPDIDERLMARVSDGGSFGEIALVRHMPRTATIRSEEDTLLLELAKNDFHKYRAFESGIFYNGIMCALQKQANETMAESFRKYKIPLFKAVPLDKFHLLSRHATVNHYKKGDYVVKDTDDIRALYVIAHGTVGVYVTKKTNALSPVPSLRPDASNPITPSDDISTATRSSHKVTFAETTKARDTLTSDLLEHLWESEVVRDSQRASGTLVSDASASPPMDEEKREQPNWASAVELDDLCAHRKDDSLTSALSMASTASHVLSLQNLRCIREGRRGAGKTAHNMARFAFLTSVTIGASDFIETRSQKAAQLGKLTAALLESPRAKAAAAATGAFPDVHFEAMQLAEATDSDEAIDTEPKPGAGLLLCAKRVSGERPRLPLIEVSEEVMSESAELTPLSASGHQQSQSAGLSKMRGFRTPQPPILRKRLTDAGTVGDKLQPHSGKKKRRSSMPTTLQEIDEFSLFHKKGDANLVKFGSLLKKYDSKRVSHGRRNSRLVVVRQLVSPLPTREPSAVRMLSVPSTVEDEDLCEVEMDGVIEMDDESPQPPQPQLALQRSTSGCSTHSTHETLLEIEVSVLKAGNWFGESTLAEASGEAKGGAALLETVVEETQRPSTDSSLPSPVASPPRSSGRTLSEMFASSPLLLAEAKARETEMARKKAPTVVDKKMVYRGSRPAFRVTSDRCVIFQLDKKDCDEFFKEVPEAKQWFDIMLAKYAIGLGVLLKIPKATEAFSMFLESEYAEENLHFVLAVNEFKASFQRMAAEARLESAQILCDLFVSNDAEQQVNLAGLNQRALLTLVQSADSSKICIDMFDTALRSIYLLLERDCFPRFKQSRDFQQFLESVENFTMTTKQDYLVKAAEERLKQAAAIERRISLMTAGAKKSAELSTPVSAIRVASIPE